MSATTTTTCGMTTQRAAMVPGASKQRMEIMSRKVFGRRARVVRVAASAPNPPTVRVRDDARPRATVQPTAGAKPSARVHLFLVSFKRLPSTVMVSRLARSDTMK